MYETNNNGEGGTFLCMRMHACVLTLPVDLEQTPGSDVKLINVKKKFSRHSLKLLVLTIRLKHI